MTSGSRFSRFLSELKRRKVYRVGVVYVLVALGVAQGADWAFDLLELPNVASQVVALLLAMGFPIALVLAWAYEIRPEEPVPLASPPEVSSEGAVARPASEPPMGDGGKSIVVLPFENLSPDPSNAFFADGLTEEVIADLSKVQEIRVISRTSAMVLKGSGRNVRSIADELHVEYVLEGSVRRSGDQVRITAQLIDAGSDMHVWAEKYSGTMEDVFDLQERLSRQIVQGLKVSITPEEDRRLGARPIPDVRSHDIWLRARQHALSMTPEGLNRARHLVEEALFLSPGNALLHATLAWVHAVLCAEVFEGNEDYEDHLEIARGHAERAVELDEDLAWSHFSMAAVHLREGEMQAFFDHALRSLEIERDSHTLAVLCIYLAAAGRVDEARRYGREAALRDPLSFLTTYAEAHAEVLDGGSERAFERLLELEQRLAPGEPWPAFEVGYAALQAGRDDEARDWLRRVAGSDSTVYAQIGQLLIDALDGDRDGAARLLASPALDRIARRDGQVACWVASALSWLGESEKALQWLALGIDKGFTNHRFLAEFDRLLEPLRDDPRFRELIERARVKEEAIYLEAE